MEILNRLFKLLPALLGAVGIVIPAIRELVIISLRILAIPFGKLEDTIVPVGNFFDSIQAIFDKFKNFLL